jgi:hypothetical protein
MICFPTIIKVVIIPGTVVVDAFLHGAFELGHEKGALS